MRSLNAILLIFAASAAGADDFQRRLAEANEFLRDGNPTAAAAAYEDLYVERPESDIVAYNLGVARHDAAKSAQEKAPEEAAKLFAGARQAYEKAAASPRPEVRDAARFNKANALVEEARLARSAGDLEGALKSLEGAVGEYDAALEAAPGFDAAKNNRGHARYLYRQIKQELEQQQQEQQQQQQQQNQDEQQSAENQNQGEDQQPQSGSENDQSEEQPSEENPESGQQEEQPREGESQPQPQSGDDRSQSDQQPEQDPSEGDPSAESEEEEEESPHSLQEMADANQDRQSEPEEQTESQASAAEQPEDQRPLEHNIEAILQSLAEQDHRQQRDDMRQRRPGYTVPKEWW